MLTPAEWEVKNIETQKSIAWGQAWNLAVEILGVTIEFEENMEGYLQKVNELATKIYPYLRAGAPDKTSGGLTPEELLETILALFKDEVEPQTADEYEETWAGTSPALLEIYHACRKQQNTLNRWKDIVKELKGQEDHINSIKE